MTTLPIILTLLSQSGYASSPLPVVELALVAAGITADDAVYDIGSGDGRVCVLAAKRYGCKSVGIELDANLVNLSRATVRRNGVEALVEIRHEDAIKADLSKATVIYLYHQVVFMKLLRPQLERLTPGTRVVCLDYPPEWMGLRPVKTLRVGKHEHRIYKWTIPRGGINADN